MGKCVAYVHVYEEFLSQKTDFTKYGSMWYHVKSSSNVVSEMKIVLK